MLSSPIRTIPSAPELHRLCQVWTGLAGFYRRWGHSPRPEDFRNLHEFGQLIKRPWYAVFADGVGACVIWSFFI